MGKPLRSAWRRDDAEFCHSGQIRQSYCSHHESFQNGWVCCYSMCNLPVATQVNGVLGVADTRDIQIWHASEGTQAPIERQPMSLYTGLRKILVFARGMRYTV